MLPTFFPAWLRDDGLEGGPDRRRPNLSDAAQRYLDRVGLGVEELFHHVLAVLHDPDYRAANAGALRMEWSRIPLPGWPGRRRPRRGGTSWRRWRHAGASWPRCWTRETPVPGVTTGALRPEIAAIAVPATVGGGNMAGEDFALKAGWGHFGHGRCRHAGSGPSRRALRIPQTSGQRWAALPETLGDGPRFDVYLNGRAYWRNVPSAVWGYKLGGYQVLKKWLSYRERRVMGRALLPEEVQHFTDTARRIGAVASGR